MKIFKTKGLYTFIGITSLISLLLVLLAGTQHIIVNPYLLWICITLLVTFCASIYIEVQFDYKSKNKLIETIKNSDSDSDFISKISKRAYEIYLETGNTNEKENWLQAEKEITNMD